MKVLVSIAGQLRTWDYCYTDLSRFIGAVLGNLCVRETGNRVFPEVQADILLTCWDVSYQIYPDYHSVDFLRKESASSAAAGVAYLREQPFIGTVYTEIESYAAAERLFKQLNFSLPETHHFPAYLSYRAGLHKRKIELENGFEYDLVLVLRPDVFYHHEAAVWQLPRLPRHGEIYCQDGLMSHPIRGVVLPAFQDMIFLMDGPTYNRYTKEVVYHYRNFRNGADFITVHFEKNYFLNHRNLLLLDFCRSLCTEAIPVRPTLDGAVWSGLESQQERHAYLCRIEEAWGQTKDRNLAEQVRQAVFQREFYLRREEENRQKITETLSRGR